MARSSLDEDQAVELAEIFRMLGDPNRFSTFGSERLTGALLDRLTHHVHILEMNGESYRLKHSRQSSKT